MTKLPIVVAIPSHRRAETLQKNTLAFLDRCGFPRSRVYVFLSDAQDRADYAHIKGVTLVHDTDIGSLREKFNYIRRWFPKGSHVFTMEDDVAAIVEKVDENKSVEVTKFDQFIKEGFELMSACRARIWGISPHWNAFYMQNDNSMNFKFCVAQAFGVVADDDKRVDITLDGKSDYERSILYYLADGHTPRLNRFGVKAVNSYTGEGGLQSEFGQEQRVQREEKAVEYLTTRYSLLCMRNEKKDSIMPEIKFRTIRESAASMRQKQMQRDRELGYGKA